MEKREQLYEGKAKVIFATDNPDLLIQYFKDDATAFNGVKKGTITDKGVVNNLVAGKLMTILDAVGIPVHFVRQLNDREQLIRRVEIIPVEVVIRNVVAGSMARRLGLDEGQQLPRPILEFYYKADALDDPLVIRDHVLVFGWATEDELHWIETTCRRINDVLIAFFANIGIRLVDYKLEFGRLHGEVGKVVLADEISPDTCRLWDLTTGEKLDKDRFRRDLGGVVEAYQEVARRMGVTSKTS
ncbi:MAG: phosphoribosylaminoimidazolesuccinocarboxamide synthase [Magnetococcales bacterium]|nr:phosphoribosylaminoimidazolesuccinocarboxamide synthase [Magnetococcales bacterium]NGZ06972.1 phosphoribosylaminoimidazolesuccinocarboxamide synthase [Magnetococcales bacterium]